MTDSKIGWKMKDYLYEIVLTDLASVPDIDA